MRSLFNHLTAASLLVLFLVTHAVGQDTLETVQFEMDDCVHLGYSVQTRVATSREGLNSIIRNDMSREFCMKKLKDIDMKKYSLLGININSGSCTVPTGLAYSVIKFDDEMKYIFEIIYDEQIGRCAAYRTYDLWVQVPSLPDGYTVEFILDPKMSDEY